VSKSSAWNLRYSPCVDYRRKVNRCIRMLPRSKDLSDTSHRSSGLFGLPVWLCCYFPIWRFCLLRRSDISAAVRFHFSSGNHPRLKDFLQAGYLARTLLRGKFTHLHAHFANLPTTVAEIVKRLTGIRYSFTAHAKDVYLTMPSELTRKIKEAECVLTCTAVNQRYLAGLADQGTPVRLAYHGVDVHRFQALRSGDPPRNGDEVPLILSVARLCEKKGLEFLIEACRILVDRGITFQCRIVGYGPPRG